MPVPAFISELRGRIGHSLLVLPFEPRRLIATCGGPTFRVIYPNGDMVSYVVTIYECAVISGTPVPDGEESLEVGWFSRSEIDRIDVSSVGRTIALLAYGELAPLDVDGLLGAPHEAPAR